MSSTTRWGFIGAGFVATQAMAPAVHDATGAVLQVAAARDVARATALQPVRVSADYCDVIDADDVDAVYISLTNEAHEEWVLAALSAGKHVLCEKPLGMSLESVNRMIAASAATGAVLIEALWYRWHPRFRRTMTLLADGAIGRPTTIDARFCFSGVPADNYRLDGRLGGGALLDVGPYTLDSALSVVRSCRADEAPQPTATVVERDEVRSDSPDPVGVDLSVRARLLIGGVEVGVEVSLDSPAAQLFTVLGATGSISWPGDEVFTVWKQPCTLRIDSGRSTYVEDFDAVDPYRLMVEQSMRVMRGEEASVMPHEDSAALAAVIDSLRAR